MNEKKSRAQQEHQRSNKNPQSAATPLTDGTTPLAPEKRDWQRILLYAAVIVGVGLFVASPAFHGTWLWDDDQEITANGALTSWAGLKEIWKGNVGADYLPLKTTILWLEWQIWQYDNACYHIINSIWHVINALLIWWLFSLLRIRWAWIGGLLFAIHPVLVESVAWVSEQKNTISLIFMLLSAITYIKYYEGGKTGNLIASIILFVAALLSKSAVIMLPFCFVLYAWWRDNKFERRDLLMLVGVAGVMLTVLGVGMAISKSDWLYLFKYSFSGAVLAAAGGGLWWNLRRDQWEYVWKFAVTTLPFFVIAVAIAVVTVHFQYKNAIGAEVIPVGGKWSRIVIAGMAIFFYLKQCVWPFAPYELIPIYPRWEVPEHPSIWMFLPWVAFAALVYLFWVYRRTWGKHLIFGLGFFFGFLVPVLGFIDMSYMRITWVADHFLYISVIGVIGLLVAGAAKLYDCVPSKGKPWALGIGVAALTFVAFDANLYSDVFLNETNMWRYTLSKNPNAWQAHSRYGKVLLDSGNRDAAFYHIQQSNRLRPDLAETNNNMGVLLLQKNRQAEAIPYFRRAVRLMPVGAFMLNYGNAMTQINMGAEAVPVYEKILRGESGPPFSALLKSKGKEALDKLFADGSNVTLGDLVGAPDGAALGKLLRAKCGGSYERVLGLKGAAAVEELVKLGVSDTLDDLRRLKTMETLEKLVKDRDGSALEEELRKHGLLDNLLKLSGGEDLKKLFTLKSSHAHLWLRTMRGSDAHETMIMGMRRPPLAHLYSMKGGDQLEQLFKMQGRGTADAWRQASGTEAADVLCEMMAGDPVTRLQESDGGNPIIWTNYGVALMQANRRDDAVLAFQKALKINPNLADARRNLEAALGRAQPQPLPAIQQDMRYPMSNVPGSAGVPLQIPSIFLNK